MASSHSCVVARGTDATYFGSFRAHAYIDLLQLVKTEKRHCFLVADTKCGIENAIKTRNQDY